MNDSRIKLRDVAKRANVSTATVSRVARGNTHVEAEIQMRVHAAARELGLDLTSGRGSQNIAFLLGNRYQLNEFQSQVLMGVEEYCSPLGWNLIFLSHTEDLRLPSAHLQLPQALSRDPKPRGVIVTGTHSAAILEQLHAQRIPFSVLGNNIVDNWDPLQYDCVTTDAVRGSLELVDYLIALGHRSIFFIGDRKLPWYAQCAEGYLQAMNQAGLEPLFSDIHSNERELGYLATKSMLVRGNRSTAIFAGNDQAASGVYAALQESGLKIPDDIAVVGFNDTIGGLLYPALTTVREFPREQGRHLAELVLRRIQHPDQPTVQILMPTELVRRDSVRPAL